MFNFFKISDFYKKVIILFLFIYILTPIIYNDAPESWQCLVQDPATPDSEGITFFYNYLLVFMVIIGVFVCYMLLVIIIKFKKRKNKTQKVEIFTHSSLLEIIWTILPAFILALIAIPSFKLLYSLDDFTNPDVTLKVIGHQWYWSYEFSDYRNIDYNTTAGNNFDSYMVSTNELKEGAFRLLEVDNDVKLPIQSHIRLLVTASDVIHSWAIPSFGLKVDACPGRLSQASIFLKREGYFYGQCSEICGINHGFMPIVVNSVNQIEFLLWNKAQTKLIFKETV
jgi:cytochrome c oxidase subunit 2